MQTVGPRDLCFSVDLPFGGDKLVILREVLVCVGGEAEVWVCPVSRLPQARRRQKLRSCLDQAQDRLCG